MSTVHTPPRPDLARAFQALSDETRLQIVELLSAGEHCVCDLQAALSAQQSRLSFHLKKLKEAGLVRDRRDGRWVHYSLEARALEALGVRLRALGREAEAVQPGAACCR